MQVYLPIAEMSVNALLIVGLGGIVGFLSGMFGVGGGFLTTPLLIFYGIPPAVAVASAANQITGSSVSGVLSHWQRGGVDVRMGMVLIAGGVTGSLIGAAIFAQLKAMGQIDLLISLSYVIFLGVIGTLMLIESVRAIMRARRGVQRPRRRRHNSLAYRLPLKMEFRKSKLYISALVPFGLGVGVGILTAVMGVGGGFIMLPAMIYLIGMPANVVVGTSLLQIIFTTGTVTILHAIGSKSVDILLAMLLLVGGVIGAQFGARAAQKLPGEQLRVLLGVLVVSVALKLLFDLLVEPRELFTLFEETAR